MAMSSFITEIDGEMMAICNRPLVDSTSPDNRDSSPPVFMFHSVGSGKCMKRSNTARRSDNTTFTFRMRCV